MGELQTEPFQFTFNGFLKVAFQGSRITSDAGLILVRELDERLGLAGIIAAHLHDARHGRNTQFRLPDLLRQSVYSRLAGYEDLNDAQRLSTDPTFRLIGSPTRLDRRAALTSTLHWFETELLPRDDNLDGLMAVNRDLIGQAETFDRADRIVLDMDSSESPVHGQQAGSAYNGHFASVCYHPLFLFTDHGDCVAAKLRPGNVSSADDWEERLVPEIDRQQAEGQRVAFRADAAFARPAIYEALEARGVQYAIRIPANKNLELAIEDLLFRAPGRPSLKPLIRYKSFQYQADSWTTPRRVVATVEHHGVEFIGESGRVLISLQFDTGQRVSGGLGLQDPDRLGLDEQHIVREAVAVRHLELPNGDARSSRQIQLIAVLNKPSSGVQGLVDLLARPLLWGEWVHCFSLKKLLGP